MKFNSIHNDKVTVAGVDAFTPISGDYTTFNYLGEDFNLTVNSFPYFEVVGDLGTIAKIETNNENGINYVKQYMRGMDGIKGAVKFDENNADFARFTPGIAVLEDDVVEYDMVINDSDQYKIFDNQTPRTNAETLIDNTLTFLNVLFEVDSVSYLPGEYDMSLDIGVRKTYKFTYLLDSTLDSIAANYIGTNNAHMTLFGVKHNGVEIFDTDTLIGQGANYTLETSSVDPSYVDNKMRRALGVGSPTLAKLSADNIVFDSVATDSGALVEDVDFTDSTTEFYPLNEGEGLIAFGEYGSRGSITNPVWVLAVIATETYACMIMDMGMTNLSIKGKWHLQS